MKVEMILNRKQGELLGVFGDQALQEALWILAENRIGALVVKDRNGALIGIFSERDFVRVIAAEGMACLESPIRNYMTANPKTCKASDEVDEVTKRMSDGRFRHMPVVEGDKLLGMVSIGDIVKSRMDQLESETAAMRDYILTG